MCRAERRRQAFLAKQRVRKWHWFNVDSNGQPMKWENSSRIIGMYAKTPKQCWRRCCNNIRKWEGPTIQELKAADIDDWDDWDDWYEE